MVAMSWTDMLEGLFRRDGKATVGGVASSVLPSGPST